MTEETVTTGMVNRKLDEFKLEIVELLKTHLTGLFPETTHNREKEDQQLKIQSQEKTINQKNQKLNALRKTDLLMTKTSTILLSIHALDLRKRSKFLATRLCHGINLGM